MSSTPRERLLDEAKTLITGDRNNQYGPPTQDFTRTADMWNAMGFSFNGEAIQPHHIAMAMICLKLSRITWTPEKQDSWTDLAGYAACGYETFVEDEIDKHGVDRPVDWDTVKLSVNPDVAFQRAVEDAKRAMQAADDAMKKATEATAADEVFDKHAWIKKANEELGINDSIPRGSNEPL